MRTKRAVYNIFFNLLLQIVVIVYGFIVPKIIISNYGSEVNGLVASITQFLSYIALIEAGFGGIIQYLLYKPIAEKNYNKINDILAASKKFFTKVSFIFVIYIIILCFVYPLFIVSTFDKLYTISLLLIISISIFSEYYIGLVYRVYLLADQKKYIISLFSTISYVLNIIVIIILSKINVSIHILKLISTIIFTLRPILQLVYVKKKYEKIDISKGNKNFKINQKYDALVQHIASVIHSSTDITVLTIFCKISEVSVYAVYNMVVSGVRKLISIFYDGLNSTFGDMIAKNEIVKLEKRFNTTETMYHMIITIIFSTTIITIVPFIEIYTRNIVDANYIRPLFGYLLVISEFIWAIRLPYSSITLAAGHYKETRNGAVVECITNIVVSIVFVQKLGIVGVAIGTIAAMFIRTCEFIYHTSKYIFKRKLSICIRKIIIIVIGTTISIIIGNNIMFLNNLNYLNWCCNSLLVFTISSIVVIFVNYIVYKSDFNEMYLLLKNLKKKGKK